jgi:hypothetical protein
MGNLDKGAQIPRKCKIYLKTVAARIVSSGRFRSEDPQRLGTTVKRLVSRICAPLIFTIIILKPIFK